MSAVLGALKYLPASLGVKALQKINPKFKNYFANALSYGVDANRAMDYLTERFSSDSQNDYKNQLEEGASKGTLRPDEAVSRSQMNNAGVPLKALKTAASFAIGGSLGRMGEEEDQQSKQPPPPPSTQPPPIPAQKQTRTQPQIRQQGKLQQAAQASGSPLDIIAQYSPEMARNLSLKIQHGKQPGQAALEVANEHKYRNIINQVEEEVGQSFPDWIEDSFANRQNQLQGSQSGQGKQQLLQAMQQATQTLQQLKGRK